MNLRQRTNERRGNEMSGYRWNQNISEHENVLFLTKNQKSWMNYFSEGPHKKPKLCWRANSTFNLTNLTSLTAFVQTQDMFQDQPGTDRCMYF